MKRRRTLISIEYSAESAQELLGRQSVRTTFKLSERSIDALSILAGQLGIKQKSLFDHLIDDISALQVIAREYSEQDVPGSRIAKTYVVSRRTLDNLERVSSRYQTPRDALVELSIERIIPLLAQEKERHEKRKALLEKMEVLLRDTEGIVDLADNTLDRDDPVHSRVHQTMRAMRSCYDDIDGYVKRGKKIEEF